MQSVSENLNIIMYLNNLSAISKETAIIRDKASQCLETDYWQHF